MFVTNTLFYFFLKSNSSMEYFYFNPSRGKKRKTIDDVMEKNELIQRLVKDVLENILDNEMEEHLGREKYERDNCDSEKPKNYRNGYSQKKLRSSF